MFSFILICHPWRSWEGETTVVACSVDLYSNRKARTSDFHGSPWIVAVWRQPFNVLYYFSVSTLSQGLYTEAFRCFIPHCCRESGNSFTVTWQLLSVKNGGNYFDCGSVDLRSKSHFSDDVRAVRWSSFIRPYNNTQFYPGSNC